MLVQHHLTKINKLLALMSWWYYIGKHHCSQSYNRKSKWTVSHQILFDKSRNENKLWASTTGI